MHDTGDFMHTTTFCYNVQNNFFDKAGGDGYGPVIRPVTILQNTNKVVSTLSVPEDTISVIEERAARKKAREEEIKNKPNALVDYLNKCFREEAIE